MASTPELRDTLIAWMIQEGKGFKLAARHFGIDVNLARSWATWGRAHGRLPRGRCAGTPAPPPASEPRTAPEPQPGPPQPPPDQPQPSGSSLTRGTPAEFYARQIDMIDVAIGRAMQAGHSGAVAGLHGELRRAREKLDEARTASGGHGDDELAGLPDEEIIARVTDDCRRWAPQWRRAVVDVHLEECRLPGLDELIQAWRDAHGGLLVLTGGRS